MICHGLLLAGGQVLGVHVHDAVGVDVEGDLDLRHAARSRRQAGQLEVAERLVVPGEVPLALVDLDHHRRLVVVGRGEHLGPLGRDRGVALDDLGHHAALGLDAEAQRGDVEQQDVLDLTLQHAGLQAGAESDDLVGIHTLVGFLATGQLLDELHHGRHPGRTTDQDHVVDRADADLGVLDHRVERAAAAIQQVGGEPLELRAGQLLLQVQRAGLAQGDVGKVDRGLTRRGEFDLGLLGRFHQPLTGDLVLAQVGAVLVLELLDQPVDDAAVPVVATEAVVALGGLDLEHAVADLQQGHVEGATTEVEDEDGLFLLALVRARTPARRRSAR